MKCTNCGKEIADDSVFCEFCGSKISNQYDARLLNILKAADLDASPLSALKARNKCYKMCEVEHPYDNKEYINLLMSERYPKLLKKCQIDNIYIWRLIISALLFIGGFIIAYSVNWEVLGPHADDYPGYKLIFYMCIFVCIITLAFIIFRKKWYNKQIQKL